MRRILVFFLLLVLSSDVSAASVCTHVDMDWHSQHVSLPKEAKIVYKKDQSGLCEVVLSFVPVVLSGDATWMVEVNDIIQVKQHLGLTSDDGSGDTSTECAKSPENK